MALATSVIAIIVTSPAAQAAGEGRPGCMSSCLVKCQASVPYLFPTVAACVADWAPRNLAREKAVRDARTKAGQR
jgi:hypothetical protein